MIEPLDYPRLETVCWRALCRHHVSEREMVIAATVIRLSFVIGEPCLRLDRALELAELTGMSKGNVHGVVQRLITSRALEVSADRRVYTFLPPSPAWPWLFAPRVDLRMADERERGIVWANKGGPRQGEMFAPPIEREFTEALAIERMRAGLLEYHQAATARFGGGSITFPATDRLPKPAPLSGAAKGGEGQSRPLGTAGRGDYSSAESSPDESGRRVKTAPAAEEVGSRIGNRVPEKGTEVPDSGTRPLKTLNDLSVLVCTESPEETENTQTLSTLNGEFPNREPGSALTPDAGEDEAMKALRFLMGQEMMARWGGWWRNQWRLDRRAVLDAVWDCEQATKTPRNPGAWMRDRYLRYHRAYQRSLA